MITQEQLDNWQSLCDAATPEPWVVAPHYSLVPPTYHRIMACVGTDVYAKGDCDVTADPVFAAEARTAVPALLGEVQRLRGLVRAAYFEGHFCGCLHRLAKKGDVAASWERSETIQKLKGGGA